MNIGIKQAHARKRSTELSTNRTAEYTLDSKSRRPALPTALKTCAAALACIAGTLPLAHAGDGTVALYGIVDVGVLYSSNQAITTSAGSAGHPAGIRGGSNVGLESGTWNGSRWGIRGSENLGGGNQAIFDLENGFNATNGKFSTSGTEFSRQAFVGLASQQYGTVTLGRQYDAFTDLVEPAAVSPLMTGAGTHPGDLDDFDNGLRFNNSVKYRSPTYRGFTFVGLYSFGGVAGSLKQKNAYSVGIGYLNGPLKAGAGFVRADNSQASGSTMAASGWSGSSDGPFNSSVNAGFATAQTLQVAGGAVAYTVGANTFEANYSNTRYNAGEQSIFNSDAVFDSVGGVVSHHFSTAWRMAASYGYTHRRAMTGSAGSAHYNQVNMSTFYDFSKTTGVYFLVGYQHASGQTLDAYGNVVAATASVGDVSNGQSSGSSNQTIVRAGLMHKF
jgi:predicted porin